MLRFDKGQHVIKANKQCEKSELKCVKTEYTTQEVAKRAYSFSKANNP